MEEKFCVMSSCSFYFFNWCNCWSCSVDKEFECLYGMTKKDIGEEFKIKE